jgi:hypothetical protein
MADPYGIKSQEQKSMSLLSSIKQSQNRTKQVATIKRSPVEKPRSVTNLKSGLSGGQTWGGPYIGPGGTDLTGKTASQQHKMHVNHLNHLKQLKSKNSSLMKAAMLRTQKNQKIKKVRSLVKKPKMGDMKTSAY